jgi:hypothetical protein
LRECPSRTGDSLRTSQRNERADERAHKVGVLGECQCCCLDLGVPLSHMHSHSYLCDR